MHLDHLHDLLLQHIVASGSTSISKKTEMNLPHQIVSTHRNKQEDNSLKFKLESSQRCIQRYTQELSWNARYIRRRTAASNSLTKIPHITTFFRNLRYIYIYIWNFPFLLSLSQLHKYHVYNRARHEQARASQWFEPSSEETSELLSHPSKKWSIFRSMNHDKETTHTISMSLSMSSIYKNANKRRTNQHIHQRRKKRSQV